MPLTQRLEVLQVNPISPVQELLKVLKAAALRVVGPTFCVTRTEPVPLHDTQRVGTLL